MSDFVRFSGTCCKLPNGSHHRLCCRRIPGFPKIDTNNDYFLARFDGALIDGQSWTRVSPNTGSVPNISPPESAVHRLLLQQLQKLEVRLVNSRVFCVLCVLCVSLALVLLSQNHVYHFLCGPKPDGNVEPTQQSATFCLSVGKT